MRCVGGEAPLEVAVPLLNGRDPRYRHPADILPPYYDCSEEELQQLCEVINFAGRESPAKLTTRF